MSCCVVARAKKFQFCRPFCLPPCHRVRGAASSAFRLHPAISFVFFLLSFFLFLFPFSSTCIFSVVPFLHRFVAFPLALNASLREILISVLFSSIGLSERDFFFIFFLVSVSVLTSIRYRELFARKFYSNRGQCNSTIFFFLRRRQSLFHRTKLKQPAKGGEGPRCVSGFSLSHKSLDEDVNEYLSFRRSVLAERAGQPRAMLLSLDRVKVERGIRTDVARSGFNGDRLTPWRKVMIFELARDRRAHEGDS